MPWRFLPLLNPIRQIALLCLLPGLVACGPTTQDGVRLYAENQFSEALPILQLHATRNDPVASYFLAQMYERGDGVKPDADRALNLYMAAAARGLPYGVAAMAALQTTAAPADQITHMLQKIEQVAAQQPEAGLPRLCEALLYLAIKESSANKNGTATNEAEAGYQEEVIPCAERLSSVDETSALRLLAVAYVSGAIGDKDFVKGAKYAEQAANVGDVRAHAMLAASYAEGLGKPQDFARAYAHASTALALGAGVMSESRRAELERLQKRAFRNLSQPAQRDAEKLARRLKDTTEPLYRSWNQQHRFAWALAMPQ